MVQSAFRDVASSYIGTLVPPGTHRGWEVPPPLPRLPQPSPAQPQGPGSHLDTLNGAFKIGPKVGHKGLQVQNPGDLELGGAAGPLQSAV